MTFKIKKGAAAVGIDDGWFEPKTRTWVPIIGCVMKGNAHVDGFMQALVGVDDPRITEAIIEMIVSSPHYRQIQVIFIHGITFAGFGVLDTVKLYETVQKPVIIILDHVPSLEKIKKSLFSNFKDAAKRWGLIRAQTELHPLEKSYWFQVVGISPTDAKEVIKVFQAKSIFPEPLRVAHLVGRIFKDWLVCPRPIE